MTEPAQTEPPQTTQADTAATNDAPQLAAEMSSLAARLEKAEQALAAATSKAAPVKPTPSAGQQKQTEADEYKAKLAALEQDAAIGRAWRESESARITKAAETMPQEWRSVVDAAGDIQAKANLVALYESQTKAQTPTTADAPASSPPSSLARKPLPQGAPVSATTTIDLVRMLANREVTPSEAARRYPKEYDAQIRSTLNGNRHQGRGMLG